MTLDHETPPTIQKATSTPRVLGLDALRGLAILLMCLSGIVPAMLPNWMYHGYYPMYRPDDAGNWVGDPANRFKFDGLWSAFTWVDWVFPMFLFAMGAAIPLALSARRARGERVLSLLKHVVSRWLLLLLFGVYVQQVTMGFIGGSDTSRAWLALLGFAIPFAVLVQLPRETPKQVVRGLRIGGLLSAAFLLLFLNTRPGSSFSWKNHDIIIVVLAHTFLVASLLWLLLPSRWWWARLLVALPIMLLAHHQSIGGKDYASLRWLDSLHPKVAEVSARATNYLNFTYVTSKEPDRRHSVLDVPTLLDDATGGRIEVADQLKPYLNFSPLWNFTWLKFLWCVIPGTIIGDLLLRGMSAGSAGTWSRRESWIFTGVLLATTVGLFAGLRHYGYPKDAFVLLRTPWLVLLTGVLPAIALVILMFLWRERTPKTLLNVFVGAMVLLGIGLALALAPGAGHNGFFERGISKGPPATLSWYLLSTGLAVLWLVLFTVWIDLRQSWGFGLLTANGQNPMLAYLGIRNLLAPLVALPLLAPFADSLGASSLDGYFAKLLTSPWAGFLWAMFKTLLLAVMVWGFTRRRLVWRA
jgi:hypothetical protein